MRKLIIVSFALIFGLFAIGSGVAIRNLLSTTTNLRQLIGLHEIEDIRQDLNLSVLKVQSYVHVSGIELSYNLDDIITNIEKMDNAINHCHDCHHEPDVQAELDYTGELARNFQERLSYVITTVKDDVSWRRENQRRASEIGDTILRHVQDMVNRAAITIQNRTDAAMIQINRSYNFLIITLVVTFLLAFFVAQFLTKRITGPIDELLTATRNITDGQLGYQTKNEASAEFKELIDTFNLMSASLAKKEKENTDLYQNLEQKMSELKKTQKQLVEAEKLTALGTLAGGIAHDFNNILCGIISNIALLKRDHHDDHDEEFKLLETIEKAGFRAAKLIQQLLTFSRQETLEEKPVNINETVTHIIDLLKNTITRLITVKLDLAESLPKVLGDQARLEQVIMNLCINARDAMPDGGEILISTAKIYLDENFCQEHPDANKGEYVEIKVADTGSGIDQEVLSRIFEPFFTTKAFGQGTGLGLAMVHGIVKSHNGFCLVDSSPGSGASFTVYLPIPRNIPSSETEGI